MKNRLATAAFFLILPVLTMVYGPTTFANEKESVEAPNFVMGDTWEFRTLFTKYTGTVVEVTPEGNHGITMTSYPNTKFIRDKNLAVIKTEGTPVDERNFIGWKFIDFPMTPGKKFSYQVQGVTAVFTISIEAVKWENVKVPAGKFRTLRIEGCWRNESSGWYDCGMTFWFAPEVKVFVKRQTPSTWAASLRNTDFELTSFSVK